MTDHEFRQLREDLMAQFDQMVNEELPPGPPGYPGESFTLPWAQKH
ncbi:MAG TPA: hypothetical protein VHT30_06990 [Acidimicrobiales bacterium]|jgi:hypothetical protein|nr:hypothetical protein [Acidimicrobiales bacterium]